MKKIIPLIFSVFYFVNLNAQAVGGWGTCEFATVATMNAFDPSTNAFDCKKVFVQATNEHYRWDGTQWILDGSENIYNADGTLEADRTVTMDGNSLSFESTDTFFIANDGKIGIGTTSPTENLDIPGSRRVQIGTEAGSGGGKLRVDIADGEADNQAIKTMVLKESGTNYAVNGTAAGVGATTNTALYGWASGATNNYGLRVDAGHAIFDDSVGIGTLTPQAFFDVDGGTIRFSDYGGGTVTGTATRLLAVDADGDIIEESLATYTNTDDQTATEVPFTAAGTISSTNVQSAIEEIEPDIYGSIDVHSDVDVSTTAPTAGDLLGWDGSNFVPVDTDNGFTIFNIFAEEQSDLDNNSHEWSFGANDGVPNGHGIVLPIDCELFAMSLDHNSSATSSTTVRIVQNTNTTLAAYQVVTSNAEQGYNTFGTPLAFSAGDIVNFRTISRTEDGSGARVSAWFRIRSTPASTSLVNDMLDVSAGGITNGQILQYNGASFVSVDLSATNITYDNSTSGLTATNTQAAIDELAAGGSSDNIYTANGTLGADRTVTMSGRDLTFDSGNNSNFLIDGFAGSDFNNPIFQIDRNTDRDLRFYHSNDTNSGYWKLGTNDAIALEVDNTSGDGVYLDEDGNFGVGTDSPARKLDVDGGQVRFSSYTGGTYDDNSPYRIIGIQTDGDAISIDPTTLSGSSGTDDQTAAEVPFTAAGSISSTNVQAAIEEIEPDIYGSIDVHSDVDISTTAPTSGDLLAWDGSNFVPVDTDNGYTIFSIHAEENGGLADNRYEWSFGANEVTLNGHGVIIPIDCELFAMSLDHEGGVNTTVQIIKNADESHGTYQVVNVGTEQGYNTFGTPLAFSAGDLVNFKTISRSANGVGARVSAWFRIRATPASTSLVNDMLDVSAGSITSGQILQYNGASFVPVDLSATNITYDNTTSGLTAINTQAAIDELAASGGSSDNIYTANGTLATDRTVIMDGNDLTFDGTGDMIIQDDAKVGIGTTTPGGQMEVVYNRDPGFAPNSDDGTNTYLSSIVGINNNSSNWSRTITALTPNVADGGISGLLTFGQGDAARQAGHIYFTDTGADGDEYIGFGIRSGFANIMSLTGNGDVGIGTAAPAAKLEVAGGGVRFSDYGAGVYEDTTAVYSLGVDADGDVIEMNTAKNSRIFYPPSFPINITASGAGSIDLHQLYIDAFNSPEVSSFGAPGAIPSYSETELYYYVTDYDTGIFSSMSIDASGVMSYNVSTVPTDNCSFINVVFVVKEP